MGPHWFCGESTEEAGWGYYGRGKIQGERVHIPSSGIEAFEQYRYSRLYAPGLDSEIGTQTGSPG